MRPIRTSSSAVPTLALLLGACAGPVETTHAEPPLEDGWAFSYSDRERDSKSPIDLRSLNERVAGQSGFVRLSADGNDLVLGDGSPARFWAVGSDFFKQKPSPEDLRRHVRFLARIGVNMVRLHAEIGSKRPNAKVTDVDEEEIDGIWRFVAEAKKQGIYVIISPYWSHLEKDTTRWGIEGYEGKGGLYALLFFDETLQRGYKAWATALYSRANPYTGLQLSMDPAVAIIQVQNEDSLFFWTTDQLKPAQKSKLAARFAAWLAQTYGSLDVARQGWAGVSHKDDNFAQGKVGLLDVYATTLPRPGPEGRRVADQVAFLAALQRKFYGEIAEFYRRDLGCRQLINASNWRTANQTLLDDIERWTYSVNDVIAANRYYNGGAHVGPNSGWMVSPGDKFTQHSALLNPRELPTNLKQVVGRPMIITESSWVNPLAFQSEGPFLAAVYQSLTGVDALSWLQTSAINYSSGDPPFWKFTISIPTVLGGFPASALMFRKGYVKRGEPVVHEERTLRSLWDRETPAIAEDPSFDPNRDKARPVPPKPGEKATAVDPLAFLVGPVEVSYDGDPSRNRVVDLSRYIDHDKKLIRSITGEVSLDYSVGLCKVDTPRAQGACGFLANAGLINLHDLSIRSINPYATLLTVSLDDLPLASSKRILVQIGTAARPTGWATREAEIRVDGGAFSRGVEIVSVGKAPWRIAEAEFGLSIRNPGLTRATLLDTAGYPSEDVPVTKSKNGVTLTPPIDTMYLLLE